MGKYSTPLKHLEVSRFIRSLRHRLLALQQTEYSNEVLTYFSTRQLTGKPFIEDFSEEPDQIIQIKQLNNALYLAEEVFDQLEKLDLSDKKSILGIYTVREQADEASRLLLKICEQVEGGFQSEIDTVLSCLTKINSLDLLSLLNFKTQTPSMALRIGHGIGRFVDQLKPVAGQLDYDLLTWVSSVLPTYIEAARHGIQSSAAQASLRLPKVDHQKLTVVLHEKTKKISKTIQTIINTLAGIKDVQSLITHLPALFQLPSHFEQIQPLLMEALQEVDHLDDTIQHLVREQLAKLKYEVLPNLFAVVDKFEMELLLEPGRLSRPVMDQIKSLYELLIQTICSYPKFKFTDKAEQLLKLEDAQFIANRTAPLREQARFLKQEFHQIEVASRALTGYLNWPEDDFSAVPQEIRQDYFVLLKPYLTLLDDELKQVVEAHLTSTSALKSTVNGWWRSDFFSASEPNPLRPALNKLQVLLRQMHVDHAFKLARNKAHIQAMYSTANMVLFDYKETTSVFDRSEKEAFSHRYSLSDGIQFNSKGEIVDPEQLTPDEAWDVYQWYDDRVTDLTQAEASCERLLDVLRANQTRNEAELKSSIIAFNPNYMPCLLENHTIQHQANRLYMTIEGASLKYEVLEPLPPTPCRLLKMTHTNPQTLNSMELISLMGNHDGLIQYGESLFYFDQIKLHLLPAESTARLMPIMQELKDNVLETRNTHCVGRAKEEFELIQSEGILAECKLYLMQLDEAKAAGYRNCYVWNRELKQLAHIDAHGETQDKIVLSSKSMLTLFLRKTNIVDQRKLAHWRIAKKSDPVVHVVVLDPASPLIEVADLVDGVRYVYVTKLELVNREWQKNCYVWDRDRQALFFINDEGQDQPVDLKRYRKYIGGLTNNGSDLNLMLINTEQDPTHNSLADLVKLVDRKRRADELARQQFKINDIETHDLNYRNLTAANIASFIAPISYGLLWRSVKPSKDELEKLIVSHYIRTDDGVLYYYNKEQNSIQELSLDSPQLTSFDAVFSTKENLNKLSPEQLKQIVLITGHTASISGLLWMSVEPRADECERLAVSHYIRTDDGLFYYNKEQNSIQALSLDSTQLTSFDAVFSSKENLDELSPEQFKQILSITGHLPSIGGHSPGIIRKGTIPLGELNCSLTQLSSIKQLQPYLPRIFDKLLERGEIVDSELSACIRSYSLIQPYLVDAFKGLKIKDIRPFDRDVVNFFSGQVYKDASLSRPFLSFEHFRPQLRGLIDELSTKKTRIAAKKETYFHLIRDQMVVVESLPVKSIYHQTFSPYVAEYMLTIEPVKRQINESSKTVFRARLALEHLNKYSREVRRVDTISSDPENKHYPWFHRFLVQLKTDLRPNSSDTAVSAQQLERHLRQILFYEIREIERNQAIVKSFDDRTPRLVEASDPSEVTAFMAMAPEFTTCLMKRSSELKPGELCLEWVGNQLSYKFLHYETPLSGNIELEQLTSLSPLHDLISLSKKAVLNILSIAYEQRKKAIDANMVESSFEEALALWQWYRVFPDENKCGKYKNIAEKAAPKVPVQPKPVIEKSTLHQSRSKYLIKHKRFGVELANLKKSIANQFKDLSESFKQELKPAASGIPFLDVSEENVVTTWALRLAPVFNTYSEGVLIPNLGHIVSGLESSLSAVHTYAPSWLERKSLPQSPHQVLAYKRLMNLAYFLEQMMLEIEKVNEDESKVSRVNHLLITYLHAADIYPLVTALLIDPHFSPLFRDIISNVDSVINAITDEAEHYSVPEHETKELKGVSNLNALYFMNVLKMLPERISLSNEAYHDKLPALQASAKVAVVNIEKIIRDYYGSFRYVRLVLDLPIIVGLLNDLPKNMTQFAEKINQRINQDLRQPPPEFFLKAMVEVDKCEMAFGLKPGTISNPLKQILDELYKGLITPLILDADAQVGLLCDDTSFKRRKESIRNEHLRAYQDLSENHLAPDLINQVLIACNNNEKDVFTHFYKMREPYRQALPYFKRALNGSNLYVMSLYGAKIANHKDCFIWDDRRSQLFYLDPEGCPNPQTGCDLYLRSIPVGEPLTVEALTCSVELSVPTGPREKQKPEVRKLNVLVNKPMVIKQGKNYFVFQQAANMEWRITELDSEVLSKMHLDFDKKTLLHRQSKYQLMYDEIASKTGVTYPIHLKNTHKMIEFIAQKRTQADLSLIYLSEQADSSLIYLSENEVKHFVLSNSHFVLQKHGVSLPNAVGCCTITMSTVPEKFDDLKLPLDYNAYYVQVKGINDALYYIDRKSKLITKLDVFPIEGRNVGTPEHVDAFQKKMSKVRKNTLMLATDFNIITTLTRHSYQPDFISNLDQFIPAENNISQLHFLATESLAYYERLHATSELAVKITQEQLDYLQTIDDAQDASNLAIMKSVFTIHFNEKIDELCRDTGNLQEYALLLLTDDVVEIKPNHLYVAINDSRLDYRVLDPAGIEQQGSFELDEIGCPLKKLVAADELLPYLSAILKITSRRGDRHTRPQSLATEYQAKLRAVLQKEYEPIMHDALNSDSKAIDRLLNETKEAFNQQHLESYRQLNAVNKALDEFMVYLNTAEEAWSTRHALFESDETIRGKRSTIDHLDALASNESDTPFVRIKKIKTYLKEDATLEHLMGFSNYESNAFAKLLQLVLGFFEAVGLYTPRVVRRVDRLLSAIEGPSLNQGRRPMVLFFSESTKSLIRKRGNALNIDEAADVPPVDNDNTPGP